MRQLLFVCTLLAAACSQVRIHAQRITVSFPSAQSATPLDGRVMLLLSNSPTGEPRMQINDSPRSQIVFGVTVDGLKPGQPVTVDATASGYPYHSLAEVPPGEYTIQAVLNRYETFHRGDGKTVKLPPGDGGDGHQWNDAPGNLYSKPAKVRMGPGAAAIAVVMDQVMPPIKPEPDSKYVKHLAIQSKALTTFWGRPTFIPACPDPVDFHAYSAVDLYGQENLFYLKGRE